MDKTEKIVTYKLEFTQIAWVEKEAKQGEVGKYVPGN